MAIEEQFWAHPKALVESIDIGSFTRIWAFAHIMKNAKIGDNCNIGDHCFIESNVIIGHYVVIKNGVSIWDGVILEDYVFVGPNAVFTNDLIPRSKVFRELVRTKVKCGASIGANAVLLSGITIGKYSMIGAGAVVTKDVPDFALVYGNPAKIRGYMCKCAKKLNFIDNIAKCDCGLEYEKIDSIVKNKE